MFSSKCEAVAIVIENAVIICIAPRVFVNQPVTIVVVADVVVGEGNDFHLHDNDLVRHPLSGVMVANNHDVVAVRIVAVVTYKWVVIAVLNITGNLQPRG